MEKVNYPTYEYSSIIKYEGSATMHGAKRVITFCLLTAVLPSVLIVLPLYLRHVKYADVIYKVSESDVIQIHEGQSTVFCQKHSLSMNSSFHAFQMKGSPEISNSRKHLRLKKSMSLPDDTLEYWGFYLLKGATVELQACSRYEGSRILVVKGDRILNTCGILEKNNKIDPALAKNHGHVIVTLESPAELVDTMIHPKIKRKNGGVAELRNTAAEQISEENDNTNDLERAHKLAMDHMNKHSSHHHIKFTMDHGSMQQNGNDEAIVNHSLSNNEVYKVSKKAAKTRRDVQHTPHHLLDRGFNHGGNAFNYTNKTIQDISVSSFENSLLECYDGNILISNPFPHSTQCKRVQFLEKTTTLKITHDVSVDGYYYYIFFSDNDLVKNDIHAIFDIYKPTFQYANLSASKTCINKTECEFPINFLSGDLVIVEVPTKDGIEQEEENLFALKSTCHPRVHIYVIFPIAVLILILLFSFL